MKMLLILTLISPSLLFIGCTHTEQKSDMEAAPSAALIPVDKAVATLISADGKEVSGTVEFTQEGKEVRVKAMIKGLKNGGAHGFHIHEFGNCAAGDFTSAGGHYNPGGHQHAGPEAQARHAGDLGNIKVNDRGLAVKQDSYSNISIAGVTAPVLGRSVVLHAKADDLKSQPAGDAGERIACGVIGVAQE